MQITGDQLKQIAYQRKITVWTADRCSVCDYPIKFQFNSEIDVKYDGGCSCSDIETARPIRFVNSSWQLLADWINQQTDLEKIKEIKQFWNI